jgi:thiamine-phosphate pyrophosphorylase
MLPRLHLVTDDAVLARPDFTHDALAVLDIAGPGVALHVRGPATATVDLHTAGRKLSSRARSVGALLIINDRLDVALACDAGGVHLGERAMASTRARQFIGTAPVLGRSLHSEAQIDALDDGTDYIFLGSILRTTSHAQAVPLGLDVLASARRSSAVPVIAIGGIGIDRIGDVMARGAWGVAMISALWNAPHREQALRAALDRVEEAARENP